MTYKSYVSKNGSVDVQRLAKVQGFPRSGKWDELKVFVNLGEIPDDVIAELEELHDNYHNQRQGVRQWLMFRLKRVIQK